MSSSTVGNRIHNHTESHSLATDSLTVRNAVALNLNPLSALPLATPTYEGQLIYTNISGAYKLQVSVQTAPGVFAWKAVTLA